ncbi:MAG: oligosaccharide flippase family protein [Candidatus Hydrogenedens sp.]|nr:oligosaccharide flippase family protein [Candidatus Hydrogenedens sp.]
MAGDKTTASSVGRDALLYLPGRAVPAVVQILTITVLTAYFSTEEIGRYELSVRFLLFLATLSALWLNMGVLRLYPAYALQGRAAAFARETRRIRWGTVALGALVGLGVWRFGPDSMFGSYRDLLPAAVFAFGAYTLFEMGLSFLRAQHRPGIYSIATTLNAGLRLPLAMLLFTAFGFGIGGMFWALSGMYIVAYVCIVRPSIHVPQDSGNPDGADILKDMLAYGVPILGVQLLNFFMNNLDRYLLKLWEGDDAVGLYAVASNLVEQPMTLVFQTFALAVIPSVSRCWESQGRADTEDLIEGVVRTFFLLCAPLLTMLAVLAPSIFAVLAHGESSGAYVAAPWLAAASFVYGFSYFANLGLHLSKRTGILLVITVAAVGVNAAANYWLIPQHGFIGAGIARVVSNGVLVVFFLMAGARSLQFRLPWLAMFRITAASAAAGVLLFLLQSRLPANIFTLALLGGIGMAVFGGALLASGEVKWSDLRRGAAALRRRTGG